MEWSPCKVPGDPQPLPEASPPGPSGTPLGSSRLWGHSYHRRAIFIVELSPTAGCYSFSPATPDCHHKIQGDFPGGPMIKTLCFHYRAHGFHLWSGKFFLQLSAAKKKKKGSLLLWMSPLSNSLSTDCLTLLVRHKSSAGSVKFQVEPHLSTP